MSNQTGPIYEVTFSIDRDIAGEYESWVAGHTRDVRGIDGVVDCNSFVQADDPDGRLRYVVLYALQGDEALDAFLEGAGGAIDNEIEARFPGRASVTARILREDVREELSGGSPDCLNCGAYLRGQYCAVCGQRSQSRLISLWELVSDAFGDLFELDSRLWQTLIPLLRRPGRLTHEYLQGRRARFMPPFRMYLVLSLLFFVVAFFDPREDLSLLFEPPPAADSEESVAPAEAAKREILDDLIEDGIVPAGEPPGNLEPEDGETDVRIGVDGSEDCEIDVGDVADMPRWLQRRLTPERLRRICERTQIDGGRAFLDKMLDNVPAALIVLLPLMAFVLKALYPLSRRYYVEHLLFFVHFHAFFFLILTLILVFARLSTIVGLPEALRVLTIVVTSFYIPVYLFVAMRRVYGQGRFVTFLKYVVLFVAYVLGFAATMLGAVAIAAFSV